MKTCVVSNIHRPALILPYVQDMNPVVGKTCDYPHPKLGQMRCMGGTSNVLKRAMIENPEENIFLVTEDDCVPSSKHNWKGAIDVGCELLSDYEAVCLHGRGWQTETGHNKFRQFEKSGWTWLAPTIEHRWVLGTLIWLCTRSAAEKFVRDDFWVHQTNIDLYLWSNRYNWCMLSNGESVFIHDRSQGSLLENGKNTEYVNR